jgi:hypothetical protein
MYSPPVVHKYVEQREEDNEETSGPFGFEADRYHDASRKTNKREDYTGKVPFSLKGYSNEQEDQENSTSQLEAGKDCWTGLKWHNGARLTISFGRYHSDLVNQRRRFCV